MDVIDIIKESTKNSSNRALEEQVHLDTDINLMEFTDVDKYSKEVVDVDVTDIIALNRGDFWKSGSNWRHTLDGVHGNGWTKEIFDYFHSPIVGQVFPAPHARGELELNQYGKSAFECTNANHRLVAGKCWLLSEQPDAPSFKQVSVTKYPVYPELIPLIEELTRGNFGCFISRVHSLDRKKVKVSGYEVQCFFMPNDKTATVYAWTGELLIKTRFSLLTLDKFLLKIKWPLPIREWSYCPLEIISRL